MRTTIAALGLLTVLAGCGGSGDSFTATGTISVASMTGQVLAADSAGTGDDCQGVEELADFREGAEVVVLDADRKKVAVGELEQGTLPKGAESARDIGFLSCDFAFTVDDVPAGDGLYTLQVGDSEKTFNQDDAEGLELTVTDE